MIAYYFPPMGTVGVLRNIMMHNCFSGIFDRVFAISIRNISIPASTRLIDENTKVYRVFNWDYRNIMNLFSGKNKDFRKNVNAGSESFTVRFFRQVVDSFPFNTIIGEGGLFYILAATFKGIYLIRKNGITHIYSSFRPVSDHIIAYNLKLIFPKLLWIADFRDLPVDMYRTNAFFPAFQWKFIRILMVKADLRTTVSAGLKRILDKNAGKTELIMNGIYNIYKPHKIEKNHKFTVLYTGSLYKKYGKPTMLLEVIHSLLDEQRISKSNFKLVYAGKDSLIWNDWVDQYRLNDISLDLGEIDFPDSVQYQFSSHILLLITWAGEKHTGILTGKIFEYLATDNPILALVNGKKDPEIEKILYDLNAGEVFYEGDKNEIGQFILKHYKEWKKTGKTLYTPGSDKYYEYTWNNRKNQIKRMLQFSQDS